MFFKGFITLTFFVKIFLFFISKSKADKNSEALELPLIQIDLKELYDKFSVV